MKTKWIAMVAAGFLALGGGTMVAARATAGRPLPKPETETVLKTHADKVSYGMGATLARSLRRQGIQIDVDALATGLRDGLTDKKLLMSDEEMRSTSTSLQDDLKSKRTQSTKDASEAREKEGRAFLAANAKKEGVVTLPSGLQYKVLKEGAGVKPTATDSVECIYRAAFIDGTELDSSERRGRPAILKVAKVIAGWKEALQLMPAGSKWQLFVPPALAYGDQGFGGRKGSAARLVEPRTTLVFDVEVRAVNPQPARAGAESRTSKPEVAVDEED